MSQSATEPAAIPPTAETPPAAQPPPSADTAAAAGEERPSDAPIAPNPIPPSFPFVLPSIEEELKKRKTMYTPEEKAAAWKEIREVVQRYSDEMIKRWNTEIDTYLVFAGLFSAVLTAFNVQSYVLLHPAPPDPTLAALQQISLQLSSFSSSGSSPTFVNSTHPAFEQTNAPPPPVPRAAVWLNTLWFTSLILSLSSATIAMLVRQWLNEYVSGLSSEDSRHMARLRQYRLNGLVKWHVGTIVNVIPILLELAVALFLAGLLILLWTLDPTVATVASVFTGLLGAFTLVTVLLPSMRRGCAYLSPQSLAVHYAIHHGTYYLIKAPVWRLLLDPLQWWIWDMQPASTPLLEHILQLLDRAMRAVCPDKPRTWRGYEQLEVSTPPQKTSLDTTTIIHAYDTSLNPRCLAICLSEFEPALVLQCLRGLYQVEERHFGGDDYYSAVMAETGQPVFLRNLWADSLLCSYASRPCSNDVDEQTWSLWEEGLSRIFARLSLHFRWTDSSIDLPSVELAGGSVGGILVALSIQLGPDNLGEDRLFIILYILKRLLDWCNHHNIRIGHIPLRHVTAALYHRLPQTTPGALACSLDLYCHIGIVTHLLNCVARQIETAPCSNISAQDHEAIVPGVNHALDTLMAVLRDVSQDTSLDQQAYVSLVSDSLSEFVNFVTEEPRAAPLHVLFSEDRISVLEQTVAVLQGVIPQQEKPQEILDVIRNRAGDKETFQAKLDRLKAFRDNLQAEHASTQPSSSASIQPPASTLALSTPGVGETV